MNRYRGLRLRAKRLGLYLCSTASGYAIQNIRGVTYHTRVSLNEIDGLLTELEKKQR